MCIIKISILFKAIFGRLSPYLSTNLNQYLLTFAIKGGRGLSPAIKLYLTKTRFCGTKKSFKPFWGNFWGFEGAGRGVSLLVEDVINVFLVVPFLPTKLDSQ